MLLAMRKAQQSSTLHLPIMSPACCRFCSICSTQVLSQTFCMYTAGILQGSTIFLSLIAQW